MKRVLPLLIALVLLLSCVPFSAAAACNTEAQAGTDLPGSNENWQNYHPYASAITSHISIQPDGRVLTISKTTNGVLDINYYNSSYKLVENRRLYLELPKYGGVYETDEHFYVITGQDNEEEIDNKEVIRVTQYDKNWNRLAYTFVPSYNTVHPFTAGSCRFAYHDGVLVVRTCHEMYASKNDGRNHQANLTFSVDTEKMELIYSMDAVANIAYGYVSHSFNQFIRYDDGYLFAVDHGDGYPRAINLMKYNSKSFRQPTGLGCYEDINFIDIPGAIGDNTTNVSVGAFEVTDTGFLVAGSTKINRSHFNIYTAYIDEESGSKKVINITNSSSTNYTTPHLTKLADNSYLLLWSDFDGKTIYYQKVNGKGEMVGKQYTVSGSLSDCAPIVSGGKVMWYTYHNNDVTFYHISTSSLALTKKTVNHGHQYVYQYDSTDHTCYCKDCGKRIGTSKHSIHTNVFDKNGDLVTKCDVCKYVASTQKITYGITETIKDSGAQSLVIHLTSGDKVLKNGVDYIRSINSSQIGYVNGKSFYTQIGITFQIPDMMSAFNYYKKTFYRLPDYATVASIANQTYTGKAINPALKITHGTKTLKKDVDYTVKCTNNVKTGSATVTITGKGNYFGTVSKTFKILPSISGAKVTGISNKAYTGKTITQSPKLVLSGKTLKNGTDYTVTYKNNKKVGTATVTIKGKGNYAGTITKTFKILTNISSAKISGITNKLYSGKAITQSPKVVLGSKTLKKGTDYTVTYKNNTKLGTATLTITGKGSYAGSISKTFKIMKKVTAAKITGITNKVYTGKAIAQSPKVVLGGKTLKKGTDYTVTYKNNTKVGTATVTIKGKGYYTGTISKTFKVLPNVAKAKITGITTKVYNGKAQVQNIKVVLSGKTLKKNTDYTVTYKNNTKVGTATITIKGKGKYAGTISKTFVIRTKKMATPTVTSPLKKYAKVTWKKDSMASGYEIVYSTSSNFKSKKTYSASAYSTTAYFSGLKSGTTYYVKIRSKKVIGGKTYYGAYSAVKKIRVK